MSPFEDYKETLNSGPSSDDEWNSQTIAHPPTETSEDEQTTRRRLQKYGKIKSSSSETGGEPRQALGNPPQTRRQQEMSALFKDISL